MTTECKQATFEFHGLFQRKVKARFDGGKITSDARVFAVAGSGKADRTAGGIRWAFRGSPAFAVDRAHRPLREPISFSPNPLILELVKHEG